MDSSFPCLAGLIGLIPCTKGAERQLLTHLHLQMRRYIPASASWMLGEVSSYRSSKMASSACGQRGNPMEIGYVGLALHHVVRWGPVGHKCGMIALLQSK